MTTASAPFTAAGDDGVVVLAGAVDGYPVITTSTPLTRLNFFDGRFLRAEDLTAEARGQRELVFASNRAGGPGIAHGLEAVVALDGTGLTVRAGLAIDPAGRVLLLTADVTASLADLLAAGAAASAPASGGTGSAGFAPCEVAGAPSAATVADTELYLLTAGHLEGLCGSAEVFGRICDDACVTSTDRPFRVDGVVLRLRPLAPGSALPASASVPLGAVHLRSRVAAAYFADRRADTPSLLSSAGLDTGVWCLGAPGPAGTEVPLAVVGRSGSAVGFLDQWTARRERIEPPARAYWAARSSLRSWDGYLAEVLQFQCHLTDVGAVATVNGGQGLVTAGVVELPPAGYLPVVPSGDVDGLLRAAFGTGVDLRLVGRPADELGHEFELGQHMDRIGLLPGLDDPAVRPQVDVFVPDGAVTARTPVDGTGFTVRARIGTRDRIGDEFPFRGAARVARRAGGGILIAAAAVGRVSSRDGAVQFVNAFGQARDAGDDVWQVLRDAVPAPGRLPLSLSRIRTAADAARRWSAGRRADAGARAATARSRREPAVFPLRAERAEAEPIALRTSLTAERDPSELRRGDSVFVRGVLEVFTPSGPRFESFELVGATLEVVRTDDVDGGRVLTVRLAGLLRGRTVANAGDETRDTSLDQTLELRVVERAGRRIVQLGEPGNEPVATLSWGGTPIGVEGTLERLGSVLGDEDPSIFSPSSEAHQIAVHALELLSGAHPEDRDYLDRVLAEQFGNDPGGLRTTVEAVHDWVLFRRRRHDAPVPPPVDADRVAVWVATMPEADSAASATDALLAGRGSDIAWRRVRTAEFDGGSAVLRGDGNDLRGAYRDAGGAEVVAFAGWGGRSAVPAGRSRTEALLRALPPAASQSDGVRIDEIAEPPDAFLDADTDGSVFLVSHPRPVPPTFRIRALVLDLTVVDDARAKALMGTLDNGERSDVENLVSGDVLRDVGEVEVRDGEPDGDQWATLVEAGRAGLAATEFGPGPSIIPGYPITYLDPQWAAAHPDVAGDVRNRVVPELLRSFRDGLSSQRERDLPVGPDRPCWVVVVVKNFLG